MDQASATSRVLQIPGVRRDIVRYVAQTSLRDAAALCRANSIFLEPARDEIWRNVDSLHHLLKCFPEDCLDYLDVDRDESDQPFFQRAPMPEEWQRFMANAARVRSLKREVDQEHLPEDVLDILAVYRPQIVLFPNIEHLEWVENDDCRSDISVYTHLFLGPRLKSLSLTKSAIFNEGPRDYYVLAALLNTVCHLKSPLRSLTLDIGGPFGKAVGEATANIIREMELEVYHGRQIPLPNDAVIRLATAHSLQNAWIMLGSGATLELPEGLIFPAVKALEITMESLEENAPRRLILDASSDSLDYVGIILRTDPHQDTVLHFFEKFSEKAVSSQMTELYFLRDTSRYEEFGGQSLPDRPEFLLGLQTFHHILKMKNLVELDIQSPYLDLDDQAIVTFIQCFPSLHRLRLMPNYYSGRVPKATLLSFVMAATHLPYIEEIGFPVNVLAPTTAVVTSEQWYNWTCFELHIADSPLPDDRVESVAQFLSIWFRHPELTLIASGSQILGDAAHAEERELHNAAWELCNQVMHPWSYWPPQT